MIAGTKLNESHEKGTQDEEGEANRQSFHNEFIKESFNNKPTDVHYVTPRKLSNMVSKRLSEASAEAHSNALTYRDMLSMLASSSESGSDAESNSDEDEYLIVTNDTSEKNNPEYSPQFASDADDDIPPQRPPRRSKPIDDNYSHSPSSDSMQDFNSCSQGYRVISKANDQPQDLPRAEVDGVDIDTIGNTDKEFSFIDQGEDTVILDVKEESIDNGIDGAVELTGTQVECFEANNTMSGNDVAGSYAELGEFSQNTNTETTESRGKSISMETGNTETSINITKSPMITEAVSTDLHHEASQLSCNDISRRLSLQVAETCLDRSSNCSNSKEPMNASLNDEDGDAEDTEKDEDGDKEEEEEDEEEPLQSFGGGAVPLTRVKCMVSMTTPKDARAHGSTDCPSFVEFDMNVDGFGCLFLPAIAPQVSAGKARHKSYLSALCKQHYNGKWSFFLF